MVSGVEGQRTVADVSLRAVVAAFLRSESAGDRVPPAREMASVLRRVGYNLDDPEVRAELTRCANPMWPVIVPPEFVEDSSDHAADRLRARFDLPAIYTLVPGIARPELIWLSLSAETIAPVFRASETCLPVDYLMVEEIRALLLQLGEPKGAGILRRTVRSVASSPG